MTTFFGVRGKQKVKLFHVVIAEFCSQQKSPKTPAKAGRRWNPDVSLVQYEKLPGHIYEKPLGSALQTTCLGARWRPRRKEIRWVILSWRGIAVRSRNDLRI